MANIYPDQILRDLRKNAYEKLVPKPLQVTVQKVPDNLTFPEDIGDRPSLVFMPTTATYTGTQSADASNVSLQSKRGLIYQRILDGKSISLTVPRGLQFNDSMNYENTASAIIQALKSAVEVANRGEVPNISKSDIYGLASTQSSIMTSLKKNALVAEQSIPNPGEFAIFRSPQPRTMQLTYKFQPKSYAESIAVEQIIKAFRSNAYPTLSRQSDLGSYTFPKAFHIMYVNASNMIRFPEVVLTDISVTYNTNSMSYHAGGSPVETDMSLTFKELVPITSEDVELGF